MEDMAIERTKRIALFLMLVVGTLLHGDSVSHVYMPAVVKALSVIGVIAK